MANATGHLIAPLIPSPEERAYLEWQVRRHRVAGSLSERCRVILRCADGVPSKAVAIELGVHDHTAGRWRRRFLKDRIEGLLDEARPGRPRTSDDDEIAAVIERTLWSAPKDATHWSIRSMAKETGFSHTTIRRIWNAFGLQLPIPSASHRDIQVRGKPIPSRGEWQAPPLALQFALAAFRRSPTPRQSPGAVAPLLSLAA